MYESFFGLNEKPFSLLPDPSFFYLSKIHREALTLVEYGLYNQSGFTVLTGEIGSGKTTLMRYLLEKLEDDLTVGLISHTHQSIGQIMDWVCVAFDLDAPPGDRIQQHRALVDFLIEQYRRGKKTLLIIDEAQNLGMDKLEEIRLLSNINADKDLVLQLFLLGQPQLREQLRNPDLEQFVQRVSASYHLGRLTAEETFYYIRHRLKIAGGSKEIFTPDACHAVFHYSRGIPRIINLICETALVFSYGAGKSRITGEAIDAFVKSDASHLLVSVNAEERESPPDYSAVFVGEPEPQEAPAPEPQETLPEAEDATQAGPSVTAEAADQDPTAEPAKQPDEGKLAPPAAPPESAEGMTKADPIAADLEPGPSHGRPSPALGGTARTLERDEEPSLAALIKPASDRAGWTTDAIAIAAGVLLGLGLVGWYLYSKRGGEADQGIAGDMPTMERPFAAAGTGSPAVSTDSAPGQGALEPSATGTPSDPSTESPGSTPQANVSEDSVSVTQVGEAEAEATPDAAGPTAATLGADFDDAAAKAPDADEMPNDLSRIEKELTALALPVTRTSPSSLLADMSGKVSFPEGSTELSQDAKRALDELSAILASANAVRLRILAHTDTKGARKNNQLLSEKRAQNVARYLSNKGIAADRIEHRGRGEDEAERLARQGNKASGQQSRRLEIEVIDQR